MIQHVVALTMNPRMWTVLLVVLPNAFLCEELHQRSGWMCTQLLMSRRSFLYCNPAVSEDRCDVYHLNGCVKMKRWGWRAGVHFPGWHYSLHFSLLCAWPLRVSCLYKSLHCSAYFSKCDSWFHHLPPLLFPPTPSRFPCSGLLDSLLQTKWWLLSLRRDVPASL